MNILVLGSKTKQNKTGIMKNITKLSYLLKTYNRATTILGHHVDLQSSQWRACSDILYNALSGGRHQSLKPSFKDAFTTTIFMFLSIWPSFVSIHAMISLFSNFHIEKPCVFSWAKIRTDFPENFNFTFFITTLKKRSKILNQTCRTFSIRELFQIVKFDCLTFLTAVVLFNQSDY